MSVTATARLAVLAALLLAITFSQWGCGDDKPTGVGSTRTSEPTRTPEPTPSVEPAPTRSAQPTPSLPTPSPEPDDGTAVPGELVGTWVSTDSGSAELVYVFAGDGTYKHAGVLLQQRDTGTFSFERGAQGSVRVDGGTMLLKPESGTQTIKDPDVPSANSERPIDTSPERYDWRIDHAGRLQLTDTGGATIEYARE